MRVLMVSTEMWPLAKVGGLADMVASLSRSLRGLGHDVRCALPSYRGTQERLPAGSHQVQQVEVALRMGSGSSTARVLRVEGDGLPAPVVLVESEILDRPGIYGDPAGHVYPDNGLRWAVFCRAVHGAVGRDGWTPDVLHAHDHQAALLPALVRWGPVSSPSKPRPATVFTIHNLGYQGMEDPSWLDAATLPRTLHYPGGPLEFYGKVNLMKVGIEAADRLTTVSPRYAEEIRSGPEFGAGLEGVLVAREGRLRGILNGIDTAVWDPSTDPDLPFRYSIRSLAQKARNKSALAQELGLEDGPSSTPLVGMVSRLVSQKGLDLLLPVLDTILAEGVPMVVLGSGEERFERSLEESAARHAGRLAYRREMNEGLAHRIEGGADMFLMPSRYEPCGLSQMYSLRYGTVPLVRAVGGLADTVTDLDEDPERANGFVFRAYEPKELLKTVRRAVRAFRNRPLWRGLVERGMSADFSWESSARRYAEVYDLALADRSQGN